MFGKKIEGSLDPQVEALMVEKTPEALKVAIRCQDELKPLLPTDGSGVLACGRTTGVGVAENSLLLFDKHGVNKAPASAITKMGAFDDRYQKRTISITFDMSAVMGTRPQLGTHIVELLTAEGFEEASRVLGAWWGLFGPK